MMYLDSNRHALIFLFSNKSWGQFNNLRGWPWHVHCFYTLGGFSMASPMNPAIKKKFSYFLARLGNMYPMVSNHAIELLVFGYDYYIHFHPYLLLPS